MDYFPLELGEILMCDSVVDSLIGVMRFNGLPLTHVEIMSQILRRVRSQPSGLLDLVPAFSEILRRR